MPLLAAAYALAAGVLALLGVHLLVLSAIALWHAGRKHRGGPVSNGLIPDSRRNVGGQHGAQPSSVNGSALAEAPAVLVQIPVYDEPPVLVARILAAAAALDWPSLRIQLLDDSPPAAAAEGAALVATLRARGLTAEHVTRATRTGFKAGALAGGLEADARHPDGPAPFVALFDADFAPAPDFLRRMLPPLFADPALAFTQARWTHPGAAASASTRAQAALLDIHFAVEQRAREAAGLFVGFNGTAGVWRADAIAAAGGWRADTLAEDLDLSLRARLAGRPGRFVYDVATAAELPPTPRAWRGQQFRWAKGALEVFRRHGWSVWAAPALPLRLRLAATAHLAAPLAWPALLTLVVLHPVLAVARALGATLGPADALGALGYVAGAAAVAAHCAAQRTLGRAWTRALRDLPAALLLPPALALAGTRAALEALRGHRTPFRRTLKHASGSAAWLPGEAGLAAYALSGGALLLALGATGPALVQAFFAASLGYAAWPRASRATTPPPAVETCAAEPSSVLA